MKAKRRTNIDQIRIPGIEASSDEILSENHYLGPYQLSKVDSP